MKKLEVATIINVYSKEEVPQPENKNVLELRFVGEGFDLAGKFEIDDDFLKKINETEDNLILFWNVIQSYLESYQRSYDK